MIKTGTVTKCSCALDLGLRRYMLWKFVINEFLTNYLQSSCGYYSLRVDPVS